MTNSLQQKLDQALAEWISEGRDMEHRKGVINFLTSGKIQKLVDQHTQEANIVIKELRQDDSVRFHIEPNEGGILVKASSNGRESWVQLGVEGSALTQTKEEE